jgi:hypothetical protein
MHSCSRNRDEIRPESPPDPGIRDPIHPNTRDFLPQKSAFASYHNGITSTEQNGTDAASSYIPIKSSIIFQLQYRAEFSADVLKELHQMLPTTTCRILPISTWPKLTILFLLVGQFQ